MPDCRRSGSSGPGWPEERLHLSVRCWSPFCQEANYPIYQNHCDRVGIYALTCAVAALNGVRNPFRGAFRAESGGGDTLGRGPFGHRRRSIPGRDYRSSPSSHRPRKGLIPDVHNLLITRRAGLLAIHHGRSAVWRTSRRGRPAGSHTKATMRKTDHKCLLIKILHSSRRDGTLARVGAAVCRQPSSPFSPHLRCPLFHMTLRVDNRVGKVSGWHVLRPLRISGEQVQGWERRDVSPALFSFTSCRFTTGPPCPTAGPVASARRRHPSGTGQ